MKLVSGTRESELAMMQTTYVNKLLTEANPDLEIDVLSMTTKGIVFIIIESTEVHGLLRLTSPLDHFVSSRGRSASWLGEIPCFGISCGSGSQRTWIV